MQFVYGGSVVVGVFFVSCGEFTDGVITDSVMVCGSSSSPSLFLFSFSFFSSFSLFSFSVFSFSTFSFISSFF